MSNARKTAIRWVMWVLMVWAPLSGVVCADQPRQNPAAIIIHANQVAFDDDAPKVAVIESVDELGKGAAFTVRDAATGQTAFTGSPEGPFQCTNWFEGRYFYRADFSSFQKSGRFKLHLESHGQSCDSFPFDVGKDALEAQTIPAIIGFYQHQRANSSQELAADAHLILYGSTNTVDLHGGWCDASGDVSKYFSHLAYANFMSPQQTPLVVWSMASVVDTKRKLLDRLKAGETLTAEAVYGADYLRRALSPEGYFYMIVFSNFNKDPNARRVVGLLANSKTTSDYQCAYREGGGMAIAALARVSQWRREGDYSSRDYLDGAEHAFAHLEINNTRYDDDGKENIIDDYCALMAATELWIATDKPVYRDAARLRAKHLNARLSSAGYFIADDGHRPFWHASDAGLPVIALARYLDKETDAALRKEALATIRANLDYELWVTADVSNPFGYARQTFEFRGHVQDGFFIPHENETGWWWQGEDARLASLATAAIVGGQLVYPGGGAYGVKPELAQFAANQTGWILGGNPYDVCLMYQFGQLNVPYMKSNFGHGSGRGGISNGITGKKGNTDGSGIDFKFADDGNEWRWTEQWIPHSAWFLQAVAAMSPNE